MAATLVDQSVQSTIVSGLSAEAAAASSTRIRGWDLLSINTSAMWSQYLASPSTNAAIGLRTIGLPGTSPTGGATG